MATKAAHKTGLQNLPTSKGGRGAGALPSVEAAKLRLNASKGLFATDAEREAFVPFDGPELAGPKEYRKP